MTSSELLEIAKAAGAETAYRKLNVWCNAGMVDCKHNGGSGDYRQFDPEVALPQILRAEKWSRLRNTPLAELVAADAAGLL